MCPICGDGPMPTPCFWETAINREPQVEMDYYWVSYETSTLSPYYVYLYSTPLCWLKYICCKSEFGSHTHIYVYTYNVLGLYLSIYIYIEIHSYQLFSCDRLALAFPWKTHFPTWKKPCVRTWCDGLAVAAAALTVSIHRCPCGGRRAVGGEHTNGLDDPRHSAMAGSCKGRRNQQQNTPKYHRIHETKNYFQHSMVLMMVFWWWSFSNPPDRWSKWSKALFAVRQDVGDESVFSILTHDAIVDVARTLAYQKAQEIWGKCIADMWISIIWIFKEIYSRKIFRTWWGYIHGCIYIYIPMGIAWGISSKLSVPRFFRQPDGIILDLPHLGDLHRTVTQQQ